jgi:hypothetical protein
VTEKLGENARRAALRGELWMPVLSAMRADQVGGAGCQSTVMHVREFEDKPGSRDPRTRGLSLPSVADGAPGLRNRRFSEVVGGARLWAGP